MTESQDTRGDAGDMYRKPPEGRTGTCPRTAMVTGSTRGLGRETALRFARAGWNVVVHGRRGEGPVPEARPLQGDADDGAGDRYRKPVPGKGTGSVRVPGIEATASEIRAVGSDAAVVRGDVADTSTQDALIGAAVQRWGRLDCLVNNAAIIRNAPLTRASEADWDELVRVDLLAPLALTRRAAGVMRPGSCITNVVSICGLWGCPGNVSYSAAKGALAGFTRGIAAELAGRRVRVNAVAPGYMPTDMGRAAPAAMDVARRAHAMGRLADPAGAAEFIFQLTRLPRVTGQVFVLDGRIR